MGSRATAKNVRVSARKARFVIDMIRGKKADVAMAQLSILKNRAAQPVMKVLSLPWRTPTRLTRMRMLMNTVLLQRMLMKEEPCAAFVQEPWVERPPSGKEVVTSPLKLVFKTPLN